MSRKKLPPNTTWHRTIRKINGKYRDVDVRRVNGKEQVRIVKSREKHPFEEGPLPTDAKPGEEFERTHLVNGRRQKTTYVKTDKNGFGTWKIKSSVWI
jgi:hypothetical protein